MLVCRGACIAVRFARKVTGNSLSRRENEGRKRPAEAEKRRKNVRQSNFFFHSFTPPNPMIDIEVGAFCEQNVNGM